MKHLYLIHHSHTDIGYTSAQATVRRHHVDYIKQILTILDQRGLHCGFRWVCESFWAVEQFLAEADEKQKADFAEAVRAGVIGLSASYANFSELLDEEVLTDLTSRSLEYGRGIGSPVLSAMNADINGFGWGQCKVLHNLGVENLFTCIHTHHGMFPLQRHQAFWWIGPDGSRLLVWNGEHYHLGNELGLAPGAVSSYLIKDECDAKDIHHDPWKVAVIRIPRLFKQLEQGGYPHDFLPVMISGLRRDNGPPSAAILDQVDRWNEAHGSKIRVEMVTLDQFFRRLRESEVEIPVHGGDWPDWWTDGSASMPAATALFRRAQRTWRVARKLTEGEGVSGGPAQSDLLDNLALYAEHTFGHAASVVDPYHPEVYPLAERKRAYAAVAHEHAQVLMGEVLAGRGEAEQGADLPLQYRVINPHPVSVRDVARLRIEHHEYYEKHVYRGIEVVDEVGGEILNGGIDPSPVTTTVLVPLTLGPGEETNLRIVPTMTRDITPDVGVPTLETSLLQGSAGVLETDTYLIGWQVPQGITTWIDRVTGQDILRRDRDHPPFIPVASRTPMPDPRDAWSVRGSLGLSRSGEDAVWSTGEVRAVRLHRSGVAPGDPLDDSRGDRTPPMFQRLEFDLKVAGCRECSLILEATAGSPKVDVIFKANKGNIWAPENLYLSLPFGSGPKGAVWLDKTGGAVRPRIDQLPGSLIDYYSVQDGFVCRGPEHWTLVAMRDTPLLQLGPLQFRPDRVRHDPGEPHPDRALPYAWLMTNYWETNFAAGLGGFHSCRFSILPSASDSVSEVVDQLRAANDGFVVFRRRDQLSSGQ